MNDKSLALIGASMLFIGAFLPIVSLPIVGQMNYFQNGRGDGVVIVVLAAIIAGCAATERVRIVLWPGLASLAVLAWTFIRLQNAIGEMREKMDAELAGNPFRGLAEAAMGAVQLQWGWAVLFIASLLVVIAGVRARRDQSATA